MEMKPIIFSTVMIRAILDGRKSVTRRVIKPQPKLPDGKYRYDGVQEGIHAVEMLSADGEPTEHYYSCGKPKYQAGDILYVRETWCKAEDIEPVFFYGYPHLVDDSYFYRADGYDEDALCKWRSPIHMHREAARLFLRVTGVRVERVQDITAEDCRAEGISVTIANWNDPNWSIDPPSTLTEKRISNATGEPFNEKSAWWREWYCELWNSINAKRDGGKYAWDKSPWVFVYEFEKVTL